MLPYKNKHVHIFYFWIEINKIAWIICIVSLFFISVQEYNSDLSLLLLILLTATYHWDLSPRRKLTNDNIIRTMIEYAATLVWWAFYHDQHIN